MNLEQPLAISFGLEIHNTVNSQKKSLTEKILTTEISLPMVALEPEN